MDQEKQRVVGYYKSVILGTKRIGIPKLAFFVPALATGGVLLLFYRESSLFTWRAAGMVLASTSLVSFVFLIAWVHQRRSKEFVSTAFNCLCDGDIARASDILLGSTILLSKRVLLGERFLVTMSWLLIEEKELGSVVFFLDRISPDSKFRKLIRIEGNDLIVDTDSARRLRKSPPTG